MWYFAAQNLRWVNEVVERKRAAGNPSVWISSVQTALGPQGHPPTPPFTCPFCSGVQSQPRVSLAFPRKIHCPRMEEPPSGSAPCCKQKSFCLFSQHSCLCSPIWSLSQNPFFWNCSKNWGVERCLSEKDPQRCSLRCSEGRSVQLGLGGMSLEQETTCEAVSGWGRCWILPGIIPNSQWNTTENHLWALPGSKLSSSSHCAPDRSRLQWHRGSRTGFVGGGGGSDPHYSGSLGGEAEAESQPSTAPGSPAPHLQPFWHLHTPLRRGVGGTGKASGKPLARRPIPPLRPHSSAASPELRAPSGALPARPLPRETAVDGAGQRGARPGTLSWLLGGRSGRTPGKLSPGRAASEWRAGQGASERAELRAPGASCPAASTARGRQGHPGGGTGHPS